jgi:hypothetical protein
MKNLVEVNLRDVKENVNYLVNVNEYERYGDVESYLLMGSGKEVLEFIKDKVGFEDDDDDNDLFNWFDESNGDGDDLISIFEV